MSIELKKKYCVCARHFSYDIISSWNSRVLVNVHCVKSGSLITTITVVTIYEICLQNLELIFGQVSVPTNEYGLMNF